MRRDIDVSVYLVTSELVAGKRNRTTEEVVLSALAGGATAIQIREKEDRKELVRLVAALKPFTAAYNVPLIVNDSVETALMVGADGAHVGQSDLPALTARRWLGANLILGVSVYTVEQALAAEAAGADYLGVGPVFATKTKTDAQAPMGLENLALIARSVSIPVVAIGGIVHANAAQVVGAGLDGVAVISAVIDQPDMAQAARSLAAIVRMAKTSIGRNEIRL